MPGRMLRLLSLLQSRREWSGQELASRLGVTDRTVRRDIERLRALDYPVIGTTGTAGGYRLASGTNLPPLLLDDGEAVAVAVGLVTGATAGLAGIGESALRALAKLQQVLPARLRPRVAALADAAAAVPHQQVPPTDPTVLTVLAACCRDREIVSFDYRDRGETASARRVEPYHLVTAQGHWYLVAFDPDRAGWRTFRTDRIDRPLPTQRRFEPRELPAADAASYLARSFARASYRYTARIYVALGAQAVRAGIYGPIPGDIEDRGPGESTVRLSADSATLVVQYIAAVAALGARIRIDAPPEITARLRELCAQLTSAGMD